MEETAPIMTKYEFTRIKGIRIQQLIDGFPPFVDVNPDDNSTLDNSPVPVPVPP